MPASPRIPRLRSAVRPLLVVCLALALAPLGAVARAQSSGPPYSPPTASADTGRPSIAAPHEARRDEPLPVDPQRIDSLAASVARELREAEAARRDSLARLARERLEALTSRVAWTPARPRQGSLVRLVIRAPADSAAATGLPASIEGTLAGEPLHFERDARGGLVAIGAIPVHTPTGSLLARLVVRGLAEGGDPARADTVTLTVPVDTGNFRTERLRVSRTYGTPPDSALQARIDREYEAAVAISARSHGTPRLWQERWVVPREARVTSGFGNAREFNGQVQSRHMGVDYAGPAGTPVRAANRGVVALTGDFFLGGNVVYVDHGAGLVTAYLHLSRVDVAVGDTVARGERIGLVGSTGRSTGPHLHWIARYGGITVDPRGLLALEPLPAARREP